jgi:acyl-CoA reductase-like NAD-dependent aldehyde dehydrogenase
VGSAEDVDAAVKAARTAFKTTWGLNVPGSVRGKLLNKLADLLEENPEQFSALESIDAGKRFVLRIYLDRAYHTTRHSILRVQRKIDCLMCRRTALLCRIGRQGLRKDYRN